MNSIYLCGLAGCGMTAMGRDIANQTSKRCVFPERIMQNHFRMTSHQLCELYGIEEYLYIVEDSLHDICQMHNAVIPLDMHMLFDEDNIMQIKQSGILVYLYQPFEVFYKKVIYSKKTSMLNKLSREQLLELFTRWHTICKISATVIIDVSRSHRLAFYKLFKR